MAKKESGIGTKKSYAIGTWKNPWGGGQQAPRGADVRGEPVQGTGKPSASSK